MISRLILITAFAIIFYGIAPLTPAFAQGFEINLSSPPLLTQGRKLIREGDSHNAKQAYSKALENDMTEAQKARAHNGLCVAYIMEETWQDALTHCDEAIKLIPNNWRYYNNRGNIFLETGKIDEALAQYEKGLKIAPSSLVIKGNIEIAIARQKGNNDKLSIEKPVQTTNI